MARAIEVLRAVTLSGVQPHGRTYVFCSRTNRSSLRIRVRPLWVLLWWFIIRFDIFFISRILCGVHLLVCLFGLFGVVFLSFRSRRLLSAIRIGLYSRASIECILKARGLAGGGLICGSHKSCSSSPGFVAFISWCVCSVCFLLFFSESVFVRVIILVVVSTCLVEFVVIRIELLRSVVFISIL